MRGLSRIQKNTKGGWKRKEKQNNVGGERAMEVPCGGEVIHFVAKKKA